MLPGINLAELCPPDLQRRLELLRQELHRFPELSLKEHRTADRLQAAVERLPLASLQRVAGTGLVARIAGRDPSSPLVCLRGDIDALPIVEETEVEFASQNPGVMHACGHDVHATWTVGAACLLAHEPPAGDVVVLLQPGEETGRGATLLIAEDVLDGVAAIFGAHVDMRYPVGEVVAQPGNVAASADEFSIDVLGHGGHAGRPHEARDPILAAALIVTALQGVVSRRIPPGLPAALTIGTVEGGTAPNVIPSAAKLTGTVRAADSTIRELLHSELQIVATQVASAQGLSADVKIAPGTPPLINNGRATEWAQEAVHRLLGTNALKLLPEPNMGGEDFAHYLEHVPGCFLRVGARGPNQDAIPAHSSRFLPDSGAICIGAAVLAETVRVASRALAEA